MEVRRKTESEKGKKVTFNKEDTEGEYKKKYKEWDYEGVFKYCLDKFHNCFIKKYAVTKQKSYMRENLLNPKSVSVDAMSSRLKILNNYLLPLTRQ